MGVVALGANSFEETKESYNKAIETLNKEVEKYINKTYAVDARCVGSNPINKSAEKEGPVVLPFYLNGSNTIDLKNTDENYKTDRAQMEANNLLITGEYYWLASRIVHTASPNFNLSINVVGSGGEELEGCLLQVNNSGFYPHQTASVGIRPCISLKSEVIKIIDGDGTKESPYIIEK